MRFPLVAFCPLVLLLACGDESNTIDSSGLSTSDTKEVESIYDLGACTNKRKGEVVFVTDDDKEYICYSNKWIPSDEIDKSDEISSSSAFSNKSFVIRVSIVKILYNLCKSLLRKR